MAHTLVLHLNSKPSERYFEALQHMIALTLGSKTDCKVMGAEESSQGHKIIIMGSDETELERLGDAIWGIPTSKGERS